VTHEQSPITETGQFPSRYSRRSFLRLGATLGLAIPFAGSLLTACSDDPDAATTDDSDDAEPGEDSAEPDDDEPEEADEPADDADEEDEEDEEEADDTSADVGEGGEIVIATTANPSSMDLLYRTNWINYHTSHHMYDPVIHLAEDETPEPWLAEDWEVSDDGLLYTLHLREDVSFHDGEHFDAEAMKFTFDRQINDPETQSYSRLVDTVESVDVVDDYTVEISLQELRVTFLIDSIAAWQSFPVSPAAVEELGEDFELRPVGTGPFRFQEFEPDSHVVMVRNEDYWNGAPYIDSVRIRIIPEPSVHTFELESESVDISFGVPIDDLSYVENDLGLIIDRQVTPNAQFVSLNLADGMTTELAIRRAIALGIDRDSIINDVLYGEVEKSRAGVAEISPFYDDSVPMIEYDPEEAARILEEAGWELDDDGFRYRDGELLQIQCLSTDHEDPTDHGNWGQMNEFFQEQLRQIGMDIRIETLEWGAYLDEWRTGNFEMTYHSQGGTFFTLHQGGAVRPDDYWSINQLGKSEEPDLVDVAEQLREIFDDMDSELDPEARSEIWREGQMLFHDHQLTVWLWHSVNSIAVQPWVQDYGYLRTVDLSKASINR
jgi:peptide/nickel transport system substrate-binding protein